MYYCKMTIRQVVFLLFFFNNLLQLPTVKRQVHKEVDLCLDFIWS